MKASTCFGITLGCCALTLGAANLEARIIQHWSFQELFDKSDLVVIATPTSTNDTKERIDLPGIAQLTPKNKTIGLPVIGIETKFKIAAVLKGKKGLKDFALHHYREADLKSGINPPNLLSFSPDKKGDFLLFLVREADGRFAPTSGQIDPALYSVHKLGAPHGFRIEIELPGDDGKKEAKD